MTSTFSAACANFCGEMVSSASVDTSFLVPCKQCSELMQEGDRLCPACGADQLVPAARTAANSALGPMDGTAAGGREIDPALGLVRPDTLWRAESRRGALPQGEEAPASSETPNRWLLGIATVLTLLLAIALVHDQFFAGEPIVAPRAAGKLGDDVKTGAQPITEGAAEPTARVTDVQAPDPAAPRERSRDASPGATDALALGRSGAPAAPASEAEPQAVVVQPPAATEPKQPACSEALAALSLCQRQ